jgi:hypothetical protein
MWFVGNTESGFVVNKPRGLTIDSIQYPRNIFALWSKAELAEIGILPYSETKPDTRYYNSGAISRTLVDGVVVGAYATHDKDVEALKKSMISSVRSQAGSLQSQVDWYWSRASKGGKAVPADVANYASAVYVAMDVKETAIDALATLADVIAYQNKAMVETRYIKHTSDEGAETYGPETEDTERKVNQVTHGWPSLEVDPAFVSII